MKNLHKKIGAMVLAGMVVLGGVAAGGVNSFAASSSKVVASDRINELNEKKVRFAIRDYGELLEVSPNEKDLVDKIKSEKYKCPKRIIKVRGQCEIPLKLIDSKRGKWDAIKVNFQNMNYLIKIKY